MLKDMVAYGADAMSGDTLSDWVDAALDAAMVTLSAAAPQLAPGIVALRETVDNSAKRGADKARQAAYDWAVGGEKQTLRLPRELTFDDMDCNHNRLKPDLTHYPTPS